MQACTPSYLGYWDKRTENSKPAEAVRVRGSILAIELSSSQFLRVRSMTPICSVTVGPCAEQCQQWQRPSRVVEPSGEQHYRREKGRLILKRLNRVSWTALTSEGRTQQASSLLVRPTSSQRQHLSHKSPGCEPLGNRLSPRDSRLHQVWHQNKAVCTLPHTLAQLLTDHPFHKGSLRSLGISEESIVTHLCPCLQGG